MVKLKVAKQILVLAKQYVKQKLIEKMPILLNSNNLKFTKHMLTLAKRATISKTAAEIYQNTTKTTTKL